MRIMVTISGSGRVMVHMMVMVKRRRRHGRIHRRMTIMTGRIQIVVA